MLRCSGVEVGAGSEVGNTFEGALNLASSWAHELQGYGPVGRAIHY